MANEFSEAVKHLVADKGISEELVLKTIEMALLAAYKKKYGTTANAETVIDEENDLVKIYSKKEIVEKIGDPVFQIELGDAKKLHSGAEIGDELLIELKPEDFGRIAAQTAKQVVRQRLKEIEKDVVYNEFKQREGEMIVGYYQREKNGNIYVNLGKTEGILPKSQQSPREHYVVGDRIKALLLEVKKGSKGLQIILSRSHPGFVKKIFELEVPEIADNTIVIKNIVRDPGYRTKISVYSPRSEIDPVGACVGLKGVRIRAIVSELEGEKIDVLKWDANIKKYIANALNPVAINRIIVTDEDKKEAIVVVPDSHLSIAIGRQGQNIRLVSKVVGWRLDVISEKEFKESEYAEYARKAADELFDTTTEEVIQLSDIPGIDQKAVGALERSGLVNIEDIIDKGAEELSKIDGMNKDMADNVLKNIYENVEIVKEEVIKEGSVPVVEKNDEEEYYECPNCGGRISDDMTKCPSCGVELEFKEDSEEKND